MALALHGNETDRQLPIGEEIFLDHVGHFVADADAASEALKCAGFTATPRSIQVNPDGNGGVSLTGTGNVTAMLRGGYIEALYRTADTALGRELDVAVARYPGVHLAAFSVSNAAAAHQRLESSGFRVRAVVNMERAVETAGGAGVARFTVARVEPNQMAEGRIQILTHHTEAAVWQPRWLSHPNGALGLVDVVIATENIEEAANRFSRFLGRPVTENAAGQFIRLDRGGVQLITREIFLNLAPGATLPSLPFIGVYAVSVRSFSVLRAALQSGDVVFTQGEKFVFARFPSALGAGAWFFVENPEALPWRTA
ncbi:MAG: VOC family protein [Xanthobacteraceae bacterium]|jgi:hypothetical protein